MKKLSVVIVMVLYLVGCNKGAEYPVNSTPMESIINSTTPTISDEIENDDAIDVNYIIFDKYFDEEKESTITWSAYFEEKHDIKINLNYINMKGIDYVLDEKLDGIIYLSIAPEYVYNKYIYQLIENNQLYDISNYYDKYNWRQIIDPAYITPVSNGEKIFAVPAISNATILPRYYNKEYLESMNFSVPATIDEFTNYVMTAKNAYLDSYPLFVSALSVSHSTADLFRSFDVYLSAYDESAICYNPKTESFEDGVFSYNFESALSYIRMLQESGYMDVFLQQPNELPVNLILASEFNCTYFKGMAWPDRIPEYEYMIGYFLEGINKDKLVEAKKDISFYVLPMFSEKADSLMETLNKMLADKQGYFDLKYGIEGVDYHYDSMVEQVARDNNFRGILQVQQLDYSSDEKEAADFISNYPATLIYETNTYFDMFTFSKLYSASELSKFSKFSNNYATQILMDLFNKDITMSDSIEAYKTEFKKQNMKSFIDSFNERLGFTTSYDY